MRKAHVIGLVLVFITVQFVALPALAGTHAHSRTGLMMGFGFGWGNAGAEVQGLNPDRANSGSGNFRLGWALNDRVTIGLENTAWIKEFDVFLLCHVETDIGSSSATSAPLPFAFAV